MFLLLTDPFRHAFGMAPAATLCLLHLLLTMKRKKKGRAYAAFCCWASPLLHLLCTYLPLYSGGSVSLQRGKNAAHLFLALRLSRLFLHIAPGVNTTLRSTLRAGTAFFVYPVALAAFLLSPGARFLCLLPTARTFNACGQQTAPRNIGDGGGVATRFGLLALTLCRCGAAAGGRLLRLCAFFMRCLPSPVGFW